MIPGSRHQAPGTRHLPAFIQRLQWLRSLLNFAFCMSSMSNVLTFDFAVAPTTTATATATGRPCWLGKCSLMSQKFIAGLHAVCAPCPNLGKRQKWQHKPNKKPKKRREENTKIVNKMQIKIIGKYVLSAPSKWVCCRAHNKASIERMAPNVGMQSVCISKYLTCGLVELADNKVFNRKTLLTYCPPGGHWPGARRRTEKEEGRRQRRAKTGCSTL